MSTEAISAYGWITLDSFQSGQTLTLPNQVLRWALPDGDGEYYRWDGEFPVGGKLSLLLQLLHQQVVLALVHGYR